MACQLNRAVCPAHLKAHRNLTFNFDRPAGGRSPRRRRIVPRRAAPCQVLRRTRFSLRPVYMMGKVNVRRDAEPSTVDGSMVQPLNG